MLWGVIWFAVKGISNSILYRLDELVETKEICISVSDWIETHIISLIYEGLLTYNSFWSVGACLCFAGTAVHHCNYHRSLKRLLHWSTATHIVIESSLSYVPTQITFRRQELISPASSIPPKIPVLRQKSCEIMRLLFSLMRLKITGRKFFLLLLEKAPPSLFR
jgi:hypothetical protein